MTPVRSSARTREHHVQEDFGYVRKDLALVAAVGAVSMGFVIVMSFVVN